MEKSNISKHHCQSGHRRRRVFVVGENLIPKNKKIKQIKQWIFGVWRRQWRFLLWPVHQFLWALFLRPSSWRVDRCLVFWGEAELHPDQIEAEPSGETTRLLLTFLSFESNHLSIRKWGEATICPPVCFSAHKEIKKIPYFVVTGSEDEGEKEGRREKQSAWELLLLLLRPPAPPPPLHGGDVQRQPVIGGVNWQIQYESRACSLSSSTGEAGSLNREWILFMLP